MEENKERMEGAGTLTEMEETFDYQRVMVDKKAANVDDIYYFRRALQALEQLVDEAKTSIFSKSIKLDRDQVDQIIKDLYGNIPEAIQYGLNMYDQRDHLFDVAQTSIEKAASKAEVEAQTRLRKANAEAEKVRSDAEQERQNILDDAQERADHMVSEHEILRRAEDEARRIISDAQTKANERRHRLDHDVSKLLRDVEQQMAEAKRMVHDCAQNFASDDEEY
ncbi:MAG: hypothetical protein MJ099_06450 [Clostridia bacterium]|nr:hypothetical protein [Clostridia bacterium]